MREGRDKGKSEGHGRKTMGGMIHSVCGTLVGGRSWEGVQVPVLALLYTRGPGLKFMSLDLVRKRAAG